MGITYSTAQTQDTGSPASKEQDVQTRPIEEITVLGERSFFILRLEIEAAEAEVYGLFNELNTNDDFDFKCTREAYTGSHIKRRRCMAAYLREAQAENTQNYLKGIDTRLSLSEVEGEVHQQTLAMEAEMTQLALDNPEFSQALRKLAELLGALNTKKAANPFYFGQ
jgi:hypothetical protein